MIRVTVTKAVSKIGMDRSRTGMIKTAATPREYGL